MTTSHAHLEALRSRHAALDSLINEERRHPSMSDILLRRLKVEKLRVKEAIELGREYA